MNQLFAQPFKVSNLPFVNANGFVIGEKAETHWGIPIYELARKVGIKQFV